ncbi:MAG: hypothetical protein AAFX85_19965 [Pseudomonadota bacterium]
MTTRSRRLLNTSLAWLLGLGLSLIAATGAQAVEASYMKVVEHAAESAFLDLSLNTSTSGTIRAKRCDHCKELRLQVTADTIVVQGNTKITLIDADQNRHLGATVLFDPETMIVTRILLRGRR